MTSAYVAGAAMIPMGRHKSSSYGGLAVPALLGALRSADIAINSVGALFCGHSFGGILTGQRIAREIGLGGIPVINVENACSSGATAIHCASRAVENGDHDVVIVVGVDKLSQFGGGTLPLISEDIEVQQGVVMPAIYAMRARRYMHERGTHLEDLALVSVKARRHGARNPYAQIRSETTIEEVLSSRMISDPLTLLQCCPTGDGAAAVVIVSEAYRRRARHPMIRLRASVIHSGQVEGGYRDMLHPKITYDCASEAYEKAGLGPADLDLIELHDAFTIAELIYYEALGLCEGDEAASLLSSGQTSFGGRTVVNPSGGLLAKGHPVGATGVAQVVEAFWQLTNQATNRQVEDARFALTHVTGGGIAGLDHGACAIHIFERAD